MKNEFARIDPEAVFASNRTRYQFLRRGRSGQRHKVWAVELLQGAKLTVPWGEVEGGPGSFLVDFGPGDFCIIASGDLLDSRYEPLDEASTLKLQDIRENFRRVRRSHLQSIARLLPVLMSDPQPGLATWNEACAQVIEMLREEVFYNLPSSTASVNNEPRLLALCDRVVKFDASQAPSLYSFAWTQLLHDLRAALQ